MKKEMLEALVADLVQELIDLGKDQGEIIYILKSYGYTDEDIKDWYGIPYVG